MDETVEHIFAMIDAYKEDNRPRQVATVNVDFVVNTLTWGLKHIRHPELLDILWRADLVSADGMPIVWTSKLLGTPLKGRVTGADLVPRLAEEAAKHGKSIYFLGGRGDVGKKAAELLKKNIRTWSSPARNLRLFMWKEKRWLKPGKTTCRLWNRLTGRELIYS